MQICKAQHICTYQLPRFPNPPQMSKYMIVILILMGVEQSTQTGQIIGIGNTQL